MVAMIRITVILGPGIDSKQWRYLVLVLNSGDSDVGDYPDRVFQVHVNYSR